MRMVRRSGAAALGRDREYGMSRVLHVSPLAATLLRALRDNPSWGGELPSWLAVALSAHEYTEGKPTRHEVAEALEKLREAKRQRRAA